MLPQPTVNAIDGRELFHTAVQFAAANGFRFGDPDPYIRLHHPTQEIADNHRMARGIRTCQGCFPPVWGMVRECVLLRQ